MDRSVSTAVGESTAFLYTGTNSVQLGVVSQTIDPTRAAVLRGRVLDGNNVGISGVSISILDHWELGHTITRADGAFDLAVNGSQTLTLVCSRPGYLQVHRQINVPAMDFLVLADVVLTPLDSKVTTVDLSGSAPSQVVRGNPVTDADGARQATLILPSGNTAVMQFSDGSQQSVSSLSMRATEYTVGTNGPSAMPAALPPASGYTYCSELSADEAISAGATSVHFAQPVVFYLENFLGFQVGGKVPVGYYDRQRGIWVPSDDGRVVSVLSTGGGQAVLDVHGTGVAADPSELAVLGVTPDELQQVAMLYQPGQSLWRVAISHLTPWDCNWPYGPPGDAVQPQQPPPKTQKDKDDPCKGKGSIIEIQNQILGEAVGLTGCPFTLNYSSDRIPGRLSSRTMEIPISGASLPQSLHHIDVEVSIAGRHFSQQYPAAPNQTVSFTWDGQDVYGRTLNGTLPASVQIGYVYGAVYEQPAQVAQSFAALSGIPITRSLPDREYTFWQEMTAPLTFWDQRPQGLGGWSLSAHHVYDPNGQMIYFGTGERRSARNLNVIVKSYAGQFNLRGNIYSSPPNDAYDGQPALLANLSGYPFVALGPDGDLYLSDYRQAGGRVRKVRKDGTMVTVAGGGSGANWPQNVGDGGPATNAYLGYPRGLAFGPDGNLYISDDRDQTIRKVDPSGIITTVAGIRGNASPGFSGDGGPATQGQLNYAETIAVGSDGSLYLGDYDNNRVRRVDPNGIITTIVGNGTPGFAGDGGPAFAATLFHPMVSMAPDGSLYVSTGGLVRRVGPDGIIQTVIGGGTAFRQSGILATNASFGSPNPVRFGRDGSAYFIDSFSEMVWRVTPDGIVSLAAGKPFGGQWAEGWPATETVLFRPTDLAVLPDGALYLSVGGFANSAIVRVAAPLPGFSAENIAIASEDGSALYVFDKDGRHLQTIDTLTSVVLYQFQYNTGGELVSVTDLDQNTTTIEHDSLGNPLAVVGPYGARTAFQVDPNGYLASISSPANEVVTLTYSSDGLLSTLVDPRQHPHRFYYDASGLLQRDEDPAGGFTALSRADTATGWQITVTNAMNLLSTYREDILPDGTRQSTVIGADGGTNIVLTTSGGRTTNWQADGTILTSQDGPDPRFGMQSPLSVTQTVVNPSGLSCVVSATRSATLSNPDNPLSLVSLADTIFINNQPFTSTYNFDGVNRSVTTVSPMQRLWLSSLDAKGRVTQASVPGIAPVSFQYDAHGRLQTVSQAADGQTRTVTYTFDQTQNAGPSSGRLTGITDALNRTTSFDYDPNGSGRVVRETFSNGRFIQFQYDANGNLTGITPPAKPAHLFDFNSVDLLDQYTPPLATNTENNFTTYEYNLDRQLTKIVRPDGQLIQYVYDPQIGRLAQINLPFNEQISYAYNGPGCGCSGVGRPSDVTFNAVDYTASLHFTYDGSLATGVSWSGPVAGSLNATYVLRTFFSAYFRPNWHRKDFGGVTVLMS